MEIAPNHPKYCKIIIGLIILGDTLYILRLCCNYETLQRKHSGENDWSSLLSVRPSDTVRLWFCWTNTALSAGDEVVFIIITLVEISTCSCSQFGEERRIRGRGVEQRFVGKTSWTSAAQTASREMTVMMVMEKIDHEQQPWGNIRNLKFLGGWGVSKSSW